MLAIWTVATETWYDIIGIAYKHLRPGGGALMLLLAKCIGWTLLNIKSHIGPETENFLEYTWFGKTARLVITSLSRTKSVCDSR